MNRAEQIVHHMLANDAFSQWLGIKVEETKPGYARLTMTCRPEMTNGFAVAHGGITYALADSALAFASNGYGLQAMSIETSISHTRPVKAGDKLSAEARELNLSRRFGIYEVTVQNQLGKKVAHFKGTVFRSGNEWEIEE